MMQSNLVSVKGTNESYDAFSFFHILHLDNFELIKYLVQPALVSFSYLVLN